jgi:hypothetical protein
MGGKGRMIFAWGNAQDMLTGAGSRKGRRYSAEHQSKELLRDWNISMKGPDSVLLPLKEL